MYLGLSITGYRLRYFLDTGLLGLGLDLIPKYGGQGQADHSADQTVAHLAGSQQGGGSVAAIAVAGANHLLVALIVGGEAGVLNLLRNPPTIPHNPLIVVYFEPDHGFAAKGLLAVFNIAFLQELVVPLGTWSVYHETGAVLVLMGVALVAANGRDCNINII